ncbi:MAG: Hydroxylase [Gemmataceae bacterium]|nr:Hydroxylase [Gemmataceae bacterium]
MKIHLIDGTYELFRNHFGESSPFGRRSSLGGFFVPLTGPSVRDRGRIELPFGRGKPSPVSRRMSLGSALSSAPTLGRIYELTGPQS